MLGVGRPSKGTVFGAMRKIQGRSCQTFVDFFFRSLPGNCHRRRESRRLMTASRSVLRPPQLALGEMRPFLLPQQAQIAPLTPPSRTLSIPVCEFLFWTSCGRGKGRPRPALHPSGRQREARAPVAPKSVLLLLVVVVVGDEKRDILVGFRDRRRRRSRWLLARYRPLSISPNRHGTAVQNAKNGYPSHPLPSPPPSPPPSRVCAKSVGDRTDTRTRARTREENGLALSTARRTGEVWRCSNVPTRS